MVHMGYYNDNVENKSEDLIKKLEQLSKQKNPEPHRSHGQSKIKGYTGYYSEN